MRFKVYDIDAEWNHAQFFTGRGISFTDWDDCATGRGASIVEAHESAQSILAEMGYDNVEHAELPDWYEDEGYQCDCEDDDEFCEHGWFVTIYVR